MSADRAHPAGVERAPGKALASVLFTLAATVVAAAAWRFGGWGACAAVTVAVLGSLAAGRLGLRAGLARAERARVHLHEQLVAVEAQLVRARLDALHAPAPANDAENHALRELVSRAEREVARLTAEAEVRQQSKDGTLREVERVLGPWLEREKLLLDLAQIDAAANARASLPALLDAIAQKGSFASIVLSDEAGLPLAASHDARDPEGEAATSSLLFTIADRMASRGAPAPLAVLVHDEANETILHRMFRADGERYLLTARGRGRGVVPETLDPALISIERALHRATWPS